jgi:hypothetical protein
LDRCVCAFSEIKAHVKSIFWVKNSTNSTETRQKRGALDKLDLFFNLRIELTWYGNNCIARRGFGCLHKEKEKGKEADVGKPDMPESPWQLKRIGTKEPHGTARAKLEI